MNQQFVDVIRSNLRSGVPERAVTQWLLQQGWTPEQISFALAAATQPSTAPLETQGMLLKHAGGEADTFATYAVAQLQAFRVVDEGSSQLAASYIKQLAASKEAFAEKREAGLKHIRALLKWAESLFPLSTIKMIDEVIRHLKQEVQRFIEDQRARQAAALVEARSQSEVRQAVSVLAPSIPEGLTEVEHWTWKVVDETLIPASYWTRVLDRERLDREARDCKSALAIPGVIPVCTKSMRRSGR